MKSLPQELMTSAAGEADRFMVMRRHCLARILISRLKISAARAISCLMPSIHAVAIRPPGIVTSSLCYRLRLAAQHDALSRYGQAAGDAMPSKSLLANILSRSASPASMSRSCQDDARHDAFIDVITHHMALNYRRGPGARESGRPHLHQ